MRLGLIWRTPHGLIDFLVAQVVIAISRLKIDALAESSIQLNFQLFHFVSNGTELILDS